MVGSGACVEPEHAGNSTRRKKAEQGRKFQHEAPPVLRPGHPGPRASQSRLYQGFWFEQAGVLVQYIRGVGHEFGFALLN